MNQKKIFVDINLENNKLLNVSQIEAVNSNSYSSTGLTIDTPSYLSSLKPSDETTEKGILLDTGILKEYIKDHYITENKVEETVNGTKTSSISTLEENITSKATIYVKSLGLNRYSSNRRDTSILEILDDDTKVYGSGNKAVLKVDDIIAYNSLAVKEDSVTENNYLHVSNKKATLTVATEIDNNFLVKSKSFKMIEATINDSILSIRGTKLNDECDTTNISGTTLTASNSNITIGEDTSDVSIYGANGLSIKSKSETSKSSINSTEYSINSKIKFYWDEDNNSIVFEKV